MISTVLVLQVVNSHEEVKLFHINVNNVALAYETESGHLYVQFAGEKRGRKLRCLRGEPAKFVDRWAKVCNVEEVKRIPSPKKVMPPPAEIDVLLDRLNDVTVLDRIMDRPLTEKELNEMNAVPPCPSYFANNVFEFKVVEPNKECATCDQIIEAGDQCYDCNYGCVPLSRGKPDWYKGKENVPPVYSKEELLNMNTAEVKAAPKPALKYVPPRKRWFF